MHELMIFVIGLTCGILVPYLLQILDLLMNYLVNIQTLHATKVQSEINQVSQNAQDEYEEKRPCIGFQIPSEEEEYYEE